MQIKNRHEPANSRVLDPFSYMRNPATFPEEEAQNFVDKEHQFGHLMLLKYDYLTKNLWREQETYALVPRVMPIQIGDYYYYRRIDNPADCMTLYRFPVAQYN